MAVPPRTSFVGRYSELALLAECLGRAAAGEGSLLLLAGEPGIGKTSLAEEIAALAAERGAAVLWGRCWESEGAPAFWPWIEVLRALVRSRPAEQLEQDLGDGGAEVARLLPELRERLPNTSPGVPEEQPEARFRLFDGLSAFLRNTSRRQPLLVVLDDLHWADAASLAFLQFLAREAGGSRLMLLATYRDGEVHDDHPLAETLAALQRLANVERLQLTGLSAPEVAVLIGMPAGAESGTPGLAQALHDQTEGNPFFVQQVLRHLRESSPAAGGRPRLDTADLRALGVPDGVRTVLSRRLARLSASCREQLTLAAVLGRQFSLSLLGACLPTGWSEEALLDALDEAETARIIVAVGSAAGAYRFVHALVRETLYAGLTSVRRARLHRRVGEALARAYRDDLEPHLAELASHFLQAGPGVAGLAAAYAERAAGRAARLLAYEEAARLYAEALRALDQLPDAEAAHRCDLLLAGGDASSRAGEIAAARALFAAAAALARDLRDAARFAQAALGFGGLVVEVGAVDEQLCLLLEEALALLPADGGLLRIRAQARLGMELLYSSDRARREATSAEAVALARRRDDPATLVFALHARHYAIWEPATIEERLAIAREIVRLGETARDPDLALQGRRWLVPDLIECGDRRAADAEIERCAAQAEAVKRPLFRWYTVVFRAGQAIMDGRYAEAEGLIEREQLLGQRAQAGTAQIYAMAQRFALGRDRGGFEATEPWARERSGPTLPALACMAAWICLATGRSEEARTALDRLAANRFAAIRRDLTWLGSVALLADLCADLQRSDDAAILYEQLLPFAGRSAAFGIPISIGPTDLALALLAAAAGRRERAKTHFAAALAFSEGMQAPPWRAWTQYRWAQALAGDRTPAAQEQAAALLRAAGATANETGMTLLQSRLAALTDAIGAPAARYPADLTRREAEVLRLIAAGNTSREIAAVLVISLPTVERHITNLYAKIGARGRAQATAFALEHRLLPG